MGERGLAGNQTINPFPSCNVEDSKGNREMYLSKEELDGRGVYARTNEAIMKLAHVHNGED